MGRLLPRRVRYDTLELGSDLWMAAFQINDSTAHASIYVTHLTVDMDRLTDDGDAFTGSFFDNLGLHETRAFLMSLCR